MSVTEIDCQKILAYITTGSSAKKIDFKHFEVYPMTAGVGFLGNHHKLRIFLDHDMLSEEDRSTLPKTINAFIKSLPTSPDHGKYVKEIKAFEKEYHNFDRLLALLSQVSEHQWAPDCYLCEHNKLIFEDLTEIGFRMTKNKNQLMDLDHLEVAARTMAWFHSASFIFENMCSEDGKKNNIREEYANCIKESTYVEDPSNIRYHWFDCGLKSLKKMANKITKYTEHDKFLIAQKFDNNQIKDQIKAYFKTSATKLNVLCHGDLWVNNFMFRYDENNSPVECRLVDFQMTRYAPAALDLTSMLCLCADKATRVQNASKVIAIYEQTFAQHVRAANIELKEINLIADYEYFRPAALVEAILFEMTTRMDEPALTESLASPEEFFYGDRSNIVLSVFDRNEEFRERLSALIEEFVDDFVLV